MQDDEEKFPLSLDFFFFKLKKTPPIDLEKSTEWEKFVFVAKRLSADIYFGSKTFFIVHFSKYYPFSLLSRDSILHYSQRKLRKFTAKMEGACKKKGIDLLLIGSQNDGQMYEFLAQVSNFKNKRKQAQIEKVFQKEFGQAYVRQDEGFLKILIPLANTHGKF